jgi:hypothetical protein
MSERPKPPVRRGCIPCHKAAAKGWPGAVIVSPSGLAHVGLADGVTLCGKDATGAAWWWPS